MDRADRHVDCQLMCAATDLLCCSQQLVASVRYLRFRLPRGRGSFLLISRMQYNNAVEVVFVLIVITMSLTGVASASAPLKYAALGASDGVGVGADVPHEDGWVAVFTSKLPQGSMAHNYAESGTLLSIAMQRQLPQALKAKPDLVTVWLAVNDFNARVPLDVYSRDLDRMIGSLVNTGALVLVANVPDLSFVRWYQVNIPDPSRIRGEVIRWNNRIGQIVKKHNAYLVDLFTKYDELDRHPEYISGDGFHPSAEGYQRLAEIFFDAYKEATAERSLKAEL